MISIAYVTRHGCPACAAYERAVIAPLSEEYPGRVSVHATWDRLLERVNNKARITKVPLVVALSNGKELCRTATMPTLEALEDAIESHGSPPRTRGSLQAGAGRPNHSVIIPYIRGEHAATSCH